MSAFTMSREATPSPLQTEMKTRPVSTNGRSARPQRKRFLKLALFIGLPLIAVAAFFLLRSNGEEKNKLTTVKTVRGDIVEKAIAVGTIEPLTEIGVKSKISGVVKKLFVDAGQIVEAGAPLLEIKPDPTPLELAEAKRNVEVALIDFNTQQNEMQRQQQLKEKGLISDKEFQAFSDVFSQSQLKVQIAREKLALIEQGKVKIAGTNIETVIYAPIKGYILEKSINIGDPVVPLTSYQEGTILMKMADMNALIFRGTVDEIDVGKLRESMAAQIKVGALPNKIIEGRLDKISLKAKKEDNATVFPVEVIMTATNGNVLRAGYSASAEIIIQKKEKVLMIPERLVTFKNDTARVLLPKPDGTTAEKIIQTGLSDALNVEVISGLEEGQEVAERPTKKIE
ncbi:MAG: Multidrug resistance protein MdtA [bacterium]|nr:Multidrug resistance protein MdtA [bacterium]